ncbi:MAG: MATE family efflux transporter [Anaerovoracaceae bacterium]
MNHNIFFEQTKPTKLFLIVTVPGILSMLISSLYYTIDGIFVGQILGAEAFAALSLALPLVIINFSVADLIGVGSAVHISIKLGQKDDKGASAIFTTACILNVVSSTIIGALLFIFAEDLLSLMGANQTLIELGSIYLKVYALCSPLTTSMFAVDNYLKICGKVRQSLYLNIFMSLCCAIVEFIFLFIFNFGIGGAALACCIGMGLSTLIGFYPFIRGKMHLKFIRPTWKPRMLFLIFASGLPTFINTLSGRLFSLIMNVILLKVGGVYAVTAYSVLLFADGIVQPVLYGLCDSIQPAIGYNFGAKNISRVRALAIRCFVTCAIISVTLTTLIFFGKEVLINIFIGSPSAELIAMSSVALKIGCFAYLTRWISLAGQSFLSAIGHAGKATVISIAMTFVFPVALLFVLWPFGLTGLWLNLPLTCLLTALLVLIIFFQYKKTPRQS